MSACFIGIDLGTSACKALAIDEAGGVLARASAEYPLSTPRAGWAEQSPADWEGGCDAAMAALVAALPSGCEVRAIGLSGQMHGLVALDEQDQVIRPAILWCDNRTEGQCEAITSGVGGLDGLLALTSNRMLPGFTGGKLLWLRENEPASFDRMRRFLLPKDLLRLRMTGEHATDVSDASGTGLFDVRSRRWSPELLSAAGISSEQVPVAVESHAVTGRLRPEIAARWGLPDGVPVAAGGGDSVIQTTSMGVIDPGIVGMTIGTAGLVGASVASCPDNPGGRLQISCGNAPGRWHVMGVTLNGGGTLQWWRDAMSVLPGGAPSFDEIAAAAADAPCGADGLLFLPYLMGERCPHVAPDARGAWIGLARGHDLRHLSRAVLEGVLMNLRSILDLVSSRGVSWHTLRVSGGATASPFWLQTLADVMGETVATVTGAAEGGAYGAALLAGVGVGHWGTIEEAVGVIQTTGETHPRDAEAATYRRLQELHAALYDDLGGILQRIAALDRSRPATARAAA